MKSKAVLILFLETIGIAASIVLGYAISRRFHIIPEFVTYIPDFHVSVHDLIVFTCIFAVVHFLVFLAVSLAKGPNRFLDAGRFAREYLAYLVAFTLSSLIVYFATTINYDPQMIAAIGILSTGFFFAAFGAVASRGEGGSFFSALGRAVGAVLRKLASVKGVLIVGFFLIPPMLAVAFVHSRNVANQITRVRILLSGESSGDWRLVNALGTAVFSQPMLAKTAPAHPEDAYVLEREGRLIRVPFSRPEDKETVLDISARVGEVEFENGALGFDFHPEFGRPDSPKRGYVYLYYTDYHAGKQVNRISRFDLAGATPEARLASETPLLILNRNASGWHNGGSVEFGPDSFLYIALGNDIRTPDHSGLHEVLREGIIRIDVDEKGGEKSHPIARQPVNGTTAHYFIPNDNPFLGDSGILEEYWATGLRNPYRISFDKENGALYAGEVGSTAWEEVNLIEKGRHYQFPFIEGHAAMPVPRPPRMFGREKEPVYTYEHTAFDRAVIGGIVYRGKKHESLRGKYVFADNYSSKVFQMESGRESVDQVVILAQADQYAQRGISSVTETVDGEILVTLLGGRDTSPGKVLKLVRGQGAPAAASGPGPETVPAVYSYPEARSTFYANCARCHGQAGKGDGPDVGGLGIKLPDFTATAFQSARSDQHIRDVIAKGGAANGLSPIMPAWELALKEGEVDFMVKFVRELGKTHP